MKKLIIPTAKIVDKELQNIGELPPIIYPINDDTVFDFIYKQYKEIVDEIDLVCYQKKELIENKIKTYNDKNIKIISLNKLESLGKTIYNAIKDITDPIIINFGDTIISDNFNNKNTDAFFYSEEYYSKTWTYFTIENGIIKEIFDKNLDSKKEKGKIFTGVFQIFNTKYFIECLEDSFINKDKDIGSFYIALRKYSEKYKFDAIKTDNWFDIGHIDKYYNSKLEVRSREFNHINIDKNRGILKKYSDDKTKFIGEIEWYLKLPQNLEYSRPRIFNYSLSYNNPYVEMEYYSYHTIHELFLYGELKYNQWEKIFKRIKFICDDYQKYTVESSDLQKSLKEMYLDKTIERLNKLRNNDHFKIFFEKEIVINNIKYKSLNKIIDLLKDIIPKKLFNIKEFNIIHGDLCFSNILIDSNLSFVKLIDPRGKFGDYDIYGDQRYELAKLFHSVDGKYDFIIKDMFDIDYNDNIINYKISDTNINLNLYELLIKTFEIDSYKLQEIELIESLLFLSMIPLHNESLDQQYIMLATGILILNRCTNIKEN